jgi:hypothetical protein
MGLLHSATAQGQPLFLGPSIVQMPLLVLQVTGQLAQGLLGIFITCTSTICHYLHYFTLVNQGHLLGYPGSGRFLTTLGQPGSSSIEVF